MTNFYFLKNQNERSFICKIQDKLERYTHEASNSSLFIWGSIYNIPSSNIAKHVMDGFIEKGVDSFKYYDGEFLIIILEDKQTTVYRDRHGAGPQVFYNSSFFCSNPIYPIKDKKYNPAPNFEAINTFLSIGYIPAPLTSFADISKLDGGVVLEYTQDATIKELFTWEEYLSKSESPIKISAKDATQEYYRLHQEAISSRVKKIDHAALLLSGGYDSGGNIAVLREVFDKNVSSYSIGFKNNRWTELPLAKILSKTYHTNHHEYEIDGTEIKHLPKIVSHMADPFQEGGLMVNYCVMELIGNNKPQIILGGDGNDQHFGTAGKELAIKYMIKKMHLTSFQKLYNKISELPPFNSDNILFKTKFHNRKILDILKSDNFGFEQVELKNLLKKEYFNPNRSYLETIPKTYSNFDNLFSIHNYHCDIKQVINQVILHKASKMANLFSNNLTFPYMSYDIYNFLASLPRELKWSGTIKDIAKAKGSSKYLHKESLKDKLPKEITDRKKQGGFAPLPIFLDDNLQFQKISDYILSCSLSYQLLNREYVQKLLDEYSQSKKKPTYWFWNQQVNAFKIMNLLTLAVWWDIYINQREPESIIF